MEKKGEQGIQIQSVNRAIQILNLYRTYGELGVVEIAQKLGLNKSTAYGLINTLQSNDFLEQVEGTKKYRLGISLFELGEAFLSRVDVVSEIKQLFAPLVDKYPVTIHIASHRHGNVIYLDKIDKGTSLIRTSNVGKSAPMYCTGVGKAMLAYLPEEYLEKYIYSAPFIPFTPNTITSRERLKMELDQVRETGVAVDRNEVEMGLSCVAAPILTREGLPEYAVSLSFAYQRIEEFDLIEVERDLLKCTNYISKKIGYTK
ncbi:MAG: IclR family transcriptional regulator [Clostridia bacterium]|nr:IclR family transcriptional regulator [Clostridia bacterium]